jgi:hypothetical protein
MEAALKEAYAAVRHAQDVRTFHGRRTKKGSGQRETDLAEARDKLKRVMKPLRSFLGQAPYKTQSQAHQDLTDRIKEASAAIQKERRSLWKMQKRDHTTY